MPENTPPVNPPIDTPPTPPPTPPKPLVVKTVEPKLSREEVICKRLGEILAENDGLESNVSYNHIEYWPLKRELSAIDTAKRR